MKRAAALVAIGLLGVVAATAPEPPPASIVAATTTTTVPEPVAAAGFASCPWAMASDDEETFFGLTSLVPTDVLISFPLAGEIRQSVEDSLPGPGATSVRLGQYLSQGVAPATVEFSGSPAAAAALVSGPSQLAGAICPSSTPKIWQLPGGSTEAGDRLVLQLYNPFSEDASVTARAYSEHGPEPAPDLEAVVVPARSWLSFELHNLFPARARLGLIVSTEEGNVVPALVMSPETGGMALWPGVGNAEIWEFPLAHTVAMSGEVVVANDGPDEATYEVDVVRRDLTDFAVETRTVGPLGEDRLGLDALGEPPFGVRVRANAPVASVLVARGEGGVAVVPGAPVTALQWLLPGFGAHPEAAYRVWFLNPGPTDLTVTVSAVSAEGPSGRPEKVTVPEGTVRAREVEALQVFGLVAEASGPFSVAWSAAVAPDMAYVQAVPVRPTEAQP